MYYDFIYLKNGISREIKLIDENDNMNLILQIVWGSKNNKIKCGNEMAHGRNSISCDCG